MKALSTGFSFSIRSKQCFVNSTGESLRLRIDSAISRMEASTVFFPPGKIAFSGSETVCEGSIISSGRGWSLEGLLFLSKARSNFSSALRLSAAEPLGNGLIPKALSRD